MRRLDSVAEWLRRWIANPLLFERESSNLSDVEFFLLFLAIITHYTDIILIIKSTLTDINHPLLSHLYYFLISLLLTNYTHH